jgi:hypothetical protein
MKRALMPIIVGAAMLTAVNANAAHVIVTSTPQPHGAYVGPTPTYDFETPAPVVGGSIVNATVPGQHIRPVGSTGNYLSAGPVDTSPATLSLAAFGPVWKISFLWGSLDIYNTFELIDSANNVLFSINGQALKTPSDPAPGDLNRVVTFTITDAATQFNSSLNSFEVDNIAIQAVPEPATWMMMILGMIGVGFAMRRRPAEPTMRIRFS